MIVRVGAAVFLFLALAACDEPRTDYCSYGDERTLLLVDRTTAYDGSDRALLNRGLVELAQSLNAGDQLVIKTIVDNPVASQHVFEQCRPGCPPQGAADWLFAGCRAVIARRDFQRFERSLVENVLPLTRDAEEHEWSEIVRTLAAVTNDYPLNHFQRVVLFSDLIENSADVLPYRLFISDEPANLLDRLTALDIRPQLTGTDVIVFGFGRSHDPERSPLDAALSQRVREFWKSYFDSGSAKSSRVTQELKLAPSTATREALAN